MSDRLFNLLVNVPAETEEWAEELLRDVLAPADGIYRTDEALTITSTRGGNVDGLAHVRGLLSDLDDAFSEGNIDIDRLTITVEPV